jgi:hypothetical protein
VIDMGKVHENQDGMRLGDQTNADWKKYLRQLRAKPLPCDKRLSQRIRDLPLPSTFEDVYVTSDDAPWLFDP